jgi:hypothetical protein
MAQEEKTSTDTKKEWTPPRLTVLDIDSATAGPPIGMANNDNAYS